MSTNPETEGGVEPSARCSACHAMLRPDDLDAVPGAVRPDESVATMCVRCALFHPPMLRRSMRVAVVVGTLLVLLNQGDALFGAAPVSPNLWWKIPLTYCVPFFVATYGALGNAKSRVASAASPPSPPIVHGR